jgi:hypothetical protein
MTHTHPPDDELEDDDDLDAGDEDEAVVDGLYAILTVCMTLRNERVSRGISLAEVISASRCDPRAIEWVDDGDVGAPLEGLVYYAAALDMVIDLRVDPR